MSSEAARTTADARQRPILLGITSLAFGGLTVACLWLGLALVDARREAVRLRGDLQQERLRSNELLGYMVSDLRDQIAALGRLDVLEPVARKGLAYLETLPRVTEEPELLRRQGIAWDNVGEILLAQGDLNRAEKAFRNALAIAQELSASDPANTDWQHDLAISQIKLGDLGVERGDRAAAIEAYRRGLELLEAGPGVENSARQYDLGIAHERLGNVLAENGEADAALAHYRTRAGLLEDIARNDKRNARWQQELALSHAAIGDALLLKHSNDSAAEAYRQCLGHAVQYRSEQHDDADVEQTIALCRQKLADVQLSEGDAAGALTAYRSAQDTLVRLVNADPANRLRQRDAAAGHQRLAAALAALGKFDESIAGQETAIRQLEAIAERTGTPRARRDTAMAWSELAWIELRARHSRKAVDAARQGLALEPGDTVLSVRLAHALLLGGQYADAEALYRSVWNTPVQGERHAGDNVLDDFTHLWAKGVVHPDMLRIEKTFGTKR